MADEIAGGQLGSVDATPLTTLFDPNDQEAITITYQVWGKPVDVAAPAAGQVTDLNKLLKHH